MVLSKLWSAVVHRIGRVGAAVALLVVGVPLFGLLPSAVAGAAATTAPFTECPHVDFDTSCSILILVTNQGAQVLGDPTQGPYDSNDDTLVGILNDSSQPIATLPLASSTQDIFGFDGDGICTFAPGGSGTSANSGGLFPSPGSDYCTQAQKVANPNGVDPTGLDYEGPDNTFQNISANHESGTVVFNTPVAPGQSTFFSLEDTLTPTGAPSGGGQAGSDGTVGVQSGYWEVASDGGIFTFGTPFYGSTGGQALNKSVVGMAPDPATGGYWLVAKDGGVFSFNAPFYGSTGGMHLNKSIVGIASTPDGKGYWLVASDGGIFSFGDATFYGSEGGKPLNEPVVGMASTADGKGYWLVASDGGIFSFGDATFQGSTGSIKLNEPIVGMAADTSTGGYWLVASDGGIFAFGAPFLGSEGGKPLNKPVVGVAATPDGGGYWLAASDGGIFTFGDAAFFGSEGAHKLNKPVVGVAADTQI
jgi:hypothetical protein